MGVGIAIVVDVVVDVDVQSKTDRQTLTHTHTHTYETRHFTNHGDTAAVAVGASVYRLAYRAVAVR